MKYMHKSNHTQEHTHKKNLIMSDSQDKRGSVAFLQRKIPRSAAKSSASIGTWKTSEDI